MRLRNRIDKCGGLRTGDVRRPGEGWLAAPVFEAAYDDKRETPRRWLPG